jgi:probable addiction module antidote protein
LREAPSFSDEYLSTALDEADELGGRGALLSALRHIAEAQGMTVIAERAGIKRESLYRALSPKGNPTIKTLLAIMGATGLKLSVHHRTPQQKIIVKVPIRY